MSHPLSADSGTGEKLFLNEDSSDVSIVAKDNGIVWRFPAHSLFLSTQSIVFRNMLRNDFYKANGKEIVFEDVAPLTVQMLLKYIYCGTVDLENWKEGIELLKASHKYQLEHLVQKCAAFLETVVTIPTVTYIFNEATLYSLTELKRKCLRLILDAGFMLLKSKTFEILNKEAVMDIISDSRLNVDSELTVLDALIRWARLQCCRAGQQVTENNILLELKPFLQFVSSEDMSDTIKTSLPDFVVSHLEPNNCARAEFSMLRSLLPFGDVISFHVYNCKQKPLRKNFSCIRFSVDFPMYLIAFGICKKLSDNPLVLPVMLSKESTGESHMLITDIVKDSRCSIVDLSGNSFRQEIVVPKPVHLEANTVYRMSCFDDYSNTEFFFQTKLSKGNTSIKSAWFSIHSDETYGVTSFTFLHSLGK